MRRILQLEAIGAQFLELDRPRSTAVTTPACASLGCARGVGAANLDGAGGDQGAPCEGSRWRGPGVLSRRGAPRERQQHCLLRSLASVANVVDVGEVDRSWRGEKNRLGDRSVYTALGSELVTYDQNENETKTEPPASPRYYFMPGARPTTAAAAMSRSQATSPLLSLYRRLAPPRMPPDHLGFVALTTARTCMAVARPRSCCWRSRCSRSRSVQARSESVRFERKGATTYRRLLGVLIDYKCKRAMLEPAEPSHSTALLQPPELHWWTRDGKCTRSCLWGALADHCRTNASLRATTCNDCACCTRMRWKLSSALTYVDKTQVAFYAPTSKEEGSAARTGHGHIA